MKDSQHLSHKEITGLSISKANNERFSTETMRKHHLKKYIKGE